MVKNHLRILNKMKNDFRTKLNEFYKLKKEGSYDDVEAFLEANPDVRGFMEERADAAMIENPEKIKKLQDRVEQRLETIVALTSQGIPQRSAFLLSIEYDPDGHSVETVSQTYRELISKGVSPLGSVAMVNVMQFGLGLSPERTVEASQNYHIAKSAYGSNLGESDLDLISNLFVFNYHSRLEPKDLPEFTLGLKAMEELFYEE